MASTREIQFWWLLILGRCAGRGRGGNGVAISLTRGRRAQNCVHWASLHGLKRVMQVCVCVCVRVRVCVCSFVLYLRVFIAHRRRYRRRRDHL